jgi:hypothetical protein
MIETSGSAILRQVYGACAERPRTAVVNRPAPVEAAPDPPGRRRQSHDARLTRRVTQPAALSPSAALLSHMIERMGGAGSSAARGDHVDLRI